MKRLLALGAALASVFFFANAAHAIERQHHIGIAPQLAILSIDDKSTASTGGGGLIHYAYGLSDQLNFMVEAGSASVAREQMQDYPEAPRTRPAGVDNLNFGVGYIIDVFKWVPYLSLMGGVYRVAGGTVPEALFLPGLSIGAGLDYQLSRSFAVGLGIREHLMVSKLQTYPSYLTAFLRVEYMWGW
jgi:hypothetical protein